MRKDRFLVAGRPAGRLTARTAGLCLLVGLLLGLCPAARPVELARDGKATAVIVANGHDEAAGALQTYLQKITGAEIPFADAAGGKSAIVLETVETLPGTSDHPRRARQAYRIVATGERLTITGASELALQYGVYGLLQDHLGVGFYAYEYEVVPQKPTLTLAPMDELQEPAFAERSLFFFPWSSTEAIKAYARKNRHYLPEGRPIASGHTVANYKWQENCPLDPEYHAWLAARFKKEFAERDPDDRPLKVGQRDYHIKFGCDGEACPRCGPVLEKEGTYAALLVMMLNAALEKTQAEYPDHEIITFAYFNTLKAPRTVKAHPNLWVNIVSSDFSGNAAGDQLNSIRESLGNRAYKEASRDWPAVAPGKVTMWHWAANHPAFRYEWPNLYPVIDDIRLWHEQGIDGAQWQIQTAAPHLGVLKNWVWMQLAWNPQQDEEALIRRFLRGYYGEAAAPVMYEYLQTTDKLRREAAYWPSVVRWRCWRTMLRQKLLTPDVRRTLDAILVRALRAAEAEGEPAHVAHVQDARARCIDEPIIDGARVAEGFGRVTDPRDGSTWYVAGARPDVPARLDRVAATIRRYKGRKADREIAYLYQQGGQRLYELGAGDVAIEAVPAMQGRVVNLLHRPTGTALFAGPGYRDKPWVRDHHWIVESAGPDGIETVTHLNQDVWGWRIRGHLRRTLRPLADGDGFRVERRMEWLKLKPKGGTIGVHAAYDVLLSDPAVARVRISGPGVEREIPAARLVGTAERTDVAFAKDEEGAVVVEIDRGDGLVLRIATTTAGFHTVRFRPDLVDAGDQFAHEWRGDPLITAGHRTEAATLGEYRWRGPKFWPWDRDAFPVDPRPHLRLQLLGRPVAYTKQGEVVEMAAQAVTVRADGEVREAPAAAEEPPAPEAAEPVALQRRGEGRAVNPRDGAALVYVPAGAFTRGSETGGPEEQPERRIYLDGYWIYKQPVTIGQYKKYLAATGRESREFKLGSFPYVIRAPIGDEDAYPVLLNWYESQAYAAWAGGALPSEAQWEKAARGTDGRTYPWGETWDESKVARQAFAERPLGVSMQPAGSVAAGASPYGALDMAGNVFEWVGDWYAPDYYAASPERNPRGPVTGVMKVLRGGDVHHAPGAQRTTHRQPMPPHVNNWIATTFRVVVPGDAEGEPTTEE